MQDSGKTWLGIALVRRFKELGLRVGVFKPVAGHSAWSQYITIIESLSRGILVGEDVIKYASVVEDMDIEMSNPIDILLAPPDLSNYIDFDAYSYIMDLEDQFKQIVLARVSSCLNKSTHHYVFKNNVSSTPPPLRRILEHLALRLKSIEYDVENFVNMLRSSSIEDELMKCLSIIEQGKDVVLIESFNNAITPFRKILEHVDALLIVAPGVVAIYKDVKGIAKIVDEAIKKYGERGFESIHILSKIKPNITKYIRPRTSIDEDDESIDFIAKHLVSTYNSFQH